MCNCVNNCSSNCSTTITRYQGANIDCVGINTSDSLDEVVRKLSEYVCGIDGTDGADGADGADGVGVTSITYSAFSGQITVSLSDGSSFISGDLRGQGVDHVAFTSTTGTAQGQPGETDTYTFWGDVLETVNLGTFVVTNGPVGLNQTVLSIGDWDMSTDMTINVPVPVGVASADIRNIDVTIYADNGNLFPLIGGAASDSGTWTLLTGTNQIELLRTTSGQFDQALFSTTPLNRGFITITHA